MVIYQLVSSFSYGDAIGNNILSIYQALRKKGYPTQILASVIDERLMAYAQTFQPQMIQAEDIVIYHKASGEPLAEQFARLPCKKVMLYHNITPASFFKPYDRFRAWRLKHGRRQVKNLLSCLDAVWAVSSYNLQELETMGVTPKKRAVLPIILDFAQYDEPADTAILQKLRKREGTKLLFVGRIAPNKCQEDIIQLFQAYKRSLDTQAQLYLIGSCNGTEKYYAKLQGLVAELGVKDVYFTGHVSFQELLAYYQACDVFVCMSEHEGFCVPLLESMYFRLPIVAYASSAIPETLAGSGVLFRQKNIGQFCETIRRLQTDTAYREMVVAKQEKVLLEHYQREQLEKRLYELMDDLTRPETPAEVQNVAFPEISKIRNSAYYRTYIKLLPQKYGRFLRKVRAIITGGTGGGKR